MTEDITGTIADSINYAIGVLRDLVSTIHQSAIQLDGATRQTQALSAHLAKASSAQSKQIAGAPKFDKWVDRRYSDVLNPLLINR